MVINSWFFCLFYYHFLLIDVFVVLVTGWPLEEDLTLRIKAACEDEDAINLLRPSRRTASASSEGNSKTIHQEPSTTEESQYPAPEVYKGWHPPSLNAFDFKPPFWQPIRGRRAPFIWVITILEHIADLKFSPVERLADFPKIRQLFGGDSGEIFLKGSHLNSYLFFKKLWLVSQGLEKVSPDLERIVLNYLSRDRAKFLSPESVKGLEPFLLSSDPVENELANRLRSHIYKEDLVLESASISDPEHDTGLELTLSIHHYWKPVNDPRTGKLAYVEEIIEHLKDFRTSLWDRINAYEMLESRITLPDPPRQPNVDYDEDMKTHFSLKMESPENKEIIRHTKLAKYISRIGWLEDPASQNLRKIGQELHTLNRSQEMAVVKLRKIIEMTAKDTSLDWHLMVCLNAFLQIILKEHYPNEEITAREAMAKKLKQDERWSTDEEYRQLVNHFSHGDFSIIKRCAETLITSRQASLISTRSMENILGMIRHISKYDLEERANLRHKVSQTRLLKEQVGITKEKV